MQQIENIVTNLFSILEKSFEVLSNVFGSAQKGNTEYNASFSPESNVISPFNKGFNLSGTKSLTAKLSYQGALVVGATGTGKSAVVLYPSIMSMPGSKIIHDPSGELFKTAGYLAKRGVEIKVLNYTKPEISAGFNPIARANDSTSIQKVATALIETSLGNTKTGDKFWTNSAIACLVMLIKIINTQDKQYRNLRNILSLVNKMSGSPEEIDYLFSEFSDPELYEDYKSFISQDDKIVSGTLSSVKASLFIFGDDAVAKTTSFDSIDFQSFRDRPSTLFIQNAVSDQSYYSVLTSIFFSQYFSFILSRFPEANEQDIFFLIDEASSLKINTLGTASANVRKHRAGIMLLVQDYNQLVHQYGRQEADAIKQNCYAKLFFPGQSLECCKELEQISGRHTFTNKEGKKEVRPLITADEIRIMKNGFLVCGNKPPAIVKLTPYFKQTAFRQYSELPSPRLQPQAPVGPVALLTLNYRKHNEQAA